MEETACVVIVFYFLYEASTLVDVRCGADGCATGDGVLKDCFPIPIPRGDPEFSGKKCLKFVRTQEVPALSCALGELQYRHLIPFQMLADQAFDKTVRLIARGGGGGGGGGTWVFRGVHTFVIKINKYP